MTEQELAREVVAARARRDGAAHDAAAAELATRVYDYYLLRVSRFRHPQYPTVQIHPDRVADVVQDAWLRTVQMLGNLKEPEKFRGALKATVFNTCLDWCRRDLRHDMKRGGSMQDTREGADGAEYSPVDSPLATIAERAHFDSEQARAEADRLQRALAGLEDRKRKIVDLTDQGFSSKDIADALGETVANTDQLRHRAYLQIRKALSDDQH
jgi:RNA polymerase sigma factor (sigma-70 family)